MKNIYIIILIFVSPFSGTSQQRYTSNCFALEVSMGNGIYGIGSAKIGGELGLSKRQKVGLRLGAGIDISPKIGYGISFSPYTLKFIDVTIAVDHTRIFGGKYTYISDDAQPDDVYSYDNTNLIIPSISTRFFAESFAAFHITFGKAFALSDANIKHLSGDDTNINRRNISNRLLGGYRFEFGCVFRLRNWSQE